MAQLSFALEKPSELTASERAAWREFIAANPALGSPYFALEFAECCEEARADTRVLVQRRAGMAEAFLPLHVGRIGYARPLGGPLGDVQGVILAPGTGFDLNQALRAVGLPVFNFENALMSQSTFREHARHCDGSWIMDLSEGYEAWREARKAVSAKPLRNLESRRRRLEAIEEGHRYVLDDRREGALEMMIAWKRAQYRRTGVFDVFSVAWTRDLLAAILRRQSDDFSGLISSLWVGERMIAIHVGMASARLCHYWFPAYDPDFARLSPGMLMIDEMARTAAGFGHLGIELGPGDFQFKRDLGSYQVGLASGFAAMPSLLGMARKTCARVTEADADRPATGLAALPGKAIRKLDRLAAYHAA